MREIKFRVWNSDERKLEPVLGFDTYSVVTATDAERQTRANEYDRGDYVLMQYTGQKDKHGVEIYEGDIIEKMQWSRPYSYSRKRCWVRYEVYYYAAHYTPEHYAMNKKALDEDPSCFNLEPGFRTREIWNEKGYKHGSWSAFAACEIIGNIYENTELLAS